MPEENLRTFAYQVLRYTPNLVRDEWVNIGVILEDRTGARHKARLIEEPGEFARVRRLHPAADEETLRAAAVHLEQQFAAQDEGVSEAIKGLTETLSNVLQLSPRRAVLAEDFDAELDRLYRDHVAPPARQSRGEGILESTRAWIRTRLNDVFRRHRILNKLERGVRAAEFTQPGDPLRLDYAYRVNGTRGFVHSLPLQRDPAQAKVLAYTAEAIRANVAKFEFTAVTEIVPSEENERHQFVARLLAEQQIHIVALPQIETYAEELRRRLQ